MLNKRFHWSDLRRLVKNYDGVTSREIMAVDMLLDGHKVDLSKIPSRAGYRQPGAVRYQLKRLLSDHDGVSNDGLVYWIPDLYGEK